MGLKARQIQYNLSLYKYILCIYIYTYITETNAEGTARRTSFA